MSPCKLYKFDQITPFSQILHQIQPKYSSGKSDLRKVGWKAKNVATVSKYFGKEMDEEVFLSVPIDEVNVDNVSYTL